MKIKYKFIAILLIITMLLFSSGITYSIFNSESNLQTPDQQIAKFVFNTSVTNYIGLSLTDIKPGDTKEYLFSVSNTESENLSDITVNYQITVKTYHFMPITIELFKVDGLNNETLIMDCNEDYYSRNSSNELVCNSPMQLMSYANETLDNYKIKLTYSNEFNDESYADLVDYVDLEINSWQKLVEKQVTGNE